MKDARTDRIVERESLISLLPNTSLSVLNISSLLNSSFKFGMRTEAKFTKVQPVFLKQSPKQIPGVVTHILF